MATESTAQKPNMELARDRVFGTILDEIIQNTVCDIALLCRAPVEDTPVERVLIP
jgi:hypothetical protein